MCWRCASRGVESFGEPRDISQRFPPQEDELAELPGGYLSPLQLVYASHSTLGRDPSGRPLWTEQCKFLDEHQVHDLDERRRWQSLWNVITTEQAFAKQLRTET